MADILRNCVVFHTVTKLDANDRESDGKNP